MNLDVPRRYKAKYACSMTGEIQKNVALAPGEEILYSKLVRERQNWLRVQPRLLAITPLRIILLEHNLLTADWIHEIPQSAVTEISQQKSWMSTWVNLTYVEMGETRLAQLQPMRRHISESEILELFCALDAFRRGQLGSRDQP